MAVYSKLLLSAGGGIISTQQQAKQTPNTASVLIGLGGTGVHCIRTIKTQVYSRLKPDNPDAVVPTYSHIRFLGVDTTLKSKGGALEENQTEEENCKNTIRPLDDSEFFDIGNKAIARAFTNKSALKQRRELSWLEYENIELPHLTDAGAGGIRQVGRYMMMDKSESFINRVEREINNAMSGLDKPRVNIHIFTGLSGGTGSGCFLDVCYMIRSIAKRIEGVTIFGYFFMPDVNLSKVPFDNVDVRKYIPKNGYASMQELDYCMELPKNGGEFEQEYQGHRIIPWNAPPVDMCHLICATDANGNVIEDAYDYAMNVTAEYLMDFLTDSAEEFGLTEHLSNFMAMTQEADAKKVIGSKVSYCAIGASCASLPLREINTYLASELFDKFSKINTNVPSAADVEKFMISSLSKDAKDIRGVYNSLYREIRNGAGDDYSPYTDDWKFVRDYGNAELVTHYTNQTAAKLNRAEANAKSLSTNGNDQSLIGRVKHDLIGIVKDVDCGPIYAYRLFAAAQDHNLLNNIDGLIEENRKRYEQEAAQTDIRNKDYNMAKADFDNSRRRTILDNNQKRFKDYEFYLMCLEQHKLAIGIYEKISFVLEKLKSQIEEITSNYYIKLSRVMETLIETFKENREALKNERILMNESSFSIPLLKIGEIKPSLDKEIASINIQGMMDAFMTLFINNESAWIGEDENKITKLVTDFFVKTAFNNFANRSINRFLKDKYESEHGTLTDEQLAAFIYNDWMKKLTSRANPLFYFDASVWRESQTSKLAFLSYPSVSAAIKAAAKKMHSTDQLWGLKESALTDRIYVMCSACGFPLSAYTYCSQYAEMYYSSKAIGRHYYEGKAVQGMKFNDWNKLSPIKPQSHIDISAIKIHDLVEYITSARSLYDKARRFNIIDDDSYICIPDQKSVDNLKEELEKCKEYTSEIKKSAEIEELKMELQKLKNRNIKMVRTEFSYPNDGYRDNKETINSIREDYFVSAPPKHTEIYDIISSIEGLITDRNMIIDAAEKKIDDIEKNANDIGNYLNAFFTGVISIEGRNVAYKRVNFGVEQDMYLSKRTGEFSFGNLPVYQGYVSYQSLSSELKNEIKEKVDKLYEDDSPQIVDSAKKLKGTYLSEERLKAMAQIASDTSRPEEIFAFLLEVRKMFGTFCLENDL